MFPYHHRAPRSHRLLKQRGDPNRLGFSLQLCSLRFLGFVPDDLHGAPAEVRRHLANQLGLDDRSLEAYGLRGHTRTDHLLAAQTHLGYRRASPLDLLSLEAWLAERALEHVRVEGLDRGVAARVEAALRGATREIGSAIRTPPTHHGFG
jgi:hypothetical protein